MKKVTLFISIILLSSAARAQNINAKRLTVSDSIWVDGRWIKGFSSDSAMGSGADNILPTQGAVKAALLNVSNRIPFQLPTGNLSATGDTVVKASSTGWDQVIREIGNIVYFQGKYYVFYSGNVLPYTDSTSYVGIAYSTDGKTWTKGGPQQDGQITTYPSEDPFCIIKGDTAFMFTENKGVPAGNHNIILWQSTDMTTWDTVGVALDLPGTGLWDNYDVSSPAVTFNSEDSLYYLFYEGIDSTKHNASIGIATSPDLHTWTRYSGNPVISPGITLKWSNTQTVPDDLFNQNGIWYLSGHTQYATVTGGAGAYVPFMVSSSDLIHWTDYLGGWIKRNSDSFSDFGDGVMFYSDGKKRRALYLSNSGDTTLILGDFSTPGNDNSQLNLHDYQMTQNFGYFSNGYLIQTNIDTSTQLPVELVITGNSYTGLNPINTTVQAFNNTSAGFTNTVGVALGYPVPVDIFYYNGHICFWTDGSKSVTSFPRLRFSLSSSSGIPYKITSVSNEAEPIAITNKLSVNMANAFNSFKIGSSSPTYSTTLNQKPGGTGDLFNINTNNQNIFGFNYSGGTFTSYIPYVSGYYGAAILTGSTSYNQNNIRLFINPAGNIGIGTTNPSAKLQIGNSDGSNGGDIWSMSSGNPRFLFGNNASAIGRYGGFEWKSLDSTFHVYHSLFGITQLTLYPNGSIGLGKTFPGSPGIDSPLVRNQNGVINAISPNAYSRSVSLTKDSLRSLINASHLVPGNWYNVINATDSTLSIWLLATAANSLDSLHAVVPEYTYNSAYYQPFGDTLDLTDRIYGVIRCINGVWDWVVVPGHDNENLDSVSVDSARGLYVTYTKQDYYTGVGDIIAIPDDGYPFWGITCGTSVGINYSNISIYRTFNLQDSIWFNGSQWGRRNNSISNTPTDSVNFDPTDSSLTVYQHDTIPINMKPVQFSEPVTYPSIQSMAGQYRAVLYKSDASGFKVRFYNSSGDLVGIPDSKCQFIYERAAYNRVIFGENGYRQYASQPSTDIWIQGWMRKTIQ